MVHFIRDLMSDLVISKHIHDTQYLQQDQVPLSNAKLKLRPECSVIVFGLLTVEYRIYNLQMDAMAEMEAMYLFYMVLSNLLEDSVDRVCN